jgi:hypothetical protein
VELVGRVGGHSAPSPIGRLFALTELRQLADHRSQPGAKRKLDGALRAFGRNANAFAAGWGEALDDVYDGLAETLQDAGDTLSDAAP